MKCKEFEKIIPLFLSDEIEDSDLPDFIEHLDSCKDCEEELAIQYLTTAGLSRLEDSASFALDKELEMKINKAKRSVRIQKKIRRFSIIGGVLIVIILIIVALLIVLN